MRYFLTLLLATSATIGFSQLPSIGLSGPHIVTEGATNGSTGPRITLTDDNTPLIIWGKAGTGGGIFTSRYAFGLFTTPSIINPPGLPVRISSYDGPDVEAVGDIAYITYVNTPFLEAKVYTQRSLDGGITWEDTIRADENIVDYPYSPNLFVRPNGDPIVVYERGNSTETIVDQKVTYSSDQGQTWSADAATSWNFPTMPCECCPASVVAYGSTVVAFWRNNNNNIRDIHAAISFDDGDTFNDYVRVDSANWLFSQCPATAPETMISGDSLLVVYKTAGTWEDRVMMVSMHKTDFGVGNAFELDPNVNPGVIQNYPKVAGSGDTLGVVWQDNRNGNLDVFFKYSVTGVAGFSQTINLTDSTMLGAQVNPHIDYADGTFHIVFQSQNTKVYYYGAALGETTNVLENTTDAFGIAVSPNPITAQSTVVINNAKGKVALSLFDLNGKKVLDLGTTTSAQFQLPIENLSAGVYILRAVSENGQEAEEKVVIRR